MKPLPLFLILSLFLSFLLPAQSPYTNLLEDYRDRYLPEKVFVHTDKDIYAAGEIVWAALYLVDGQTHRPDSSSKLLHLELLDPDGESIIHRQIYPADGHAASELLLPADLVPGSYELVAYTSFQRNGGDAFLFRKPLTILGGLPESGGVAEPTESIFKLVSAPLSERPLRLRFFPEGGDCVSGLPCKVGVTAEDELGRPRSVDVKVAGTDGKPVVSFRTSAAGMAVFTYLPLAGVKVRARAGGEAFDLPEVLPTGLSLRVDVSPDTVALRLGASSTELLPGATVVIHLRGLPIWEQVLPAGIPAAKFLLPVDRLPEGVLTATVFDAAGVAVAERLFFIPPVATGIDLSLGEGRLRPKSPQQLQLGLPDDPGLTVDGLAGGRISLSIVPVAAAGVPTDNDIRSWLLFGSDFDRPLPALPPDLFADDPNGSLKLMDEILLTRGWRRFRWSDLGASSKPLPYPLELGIYLKGRMTDPLYTNDARPGKVFLSRLSNAYTEEQVTDLEGYFTFGPYTVFDTFPVTLQGRYRSGKRNRQNPDIQLDDNNNVSLKLLERRGGVTAPSRSPLPPPPLAPERKAAYAEVSRQALTIARTYDSLIVDLDVVDVSARRIDPVREARKKRTLFYSIPSNRIVVDEFPGARSARMVWDLLRMVPGVTVTGNPRSPNISIRGVSSINLSSQPRIYFNGILTTVDQVSLIPVETIEFVDVLKGATAAIFGVNASNGVILIYSREGSGVIIKEPGLLYTQMTGYHRVREFADFTAGTADGRPDLRTTLHWNPLLRTDEQGKATESFTTSEQTGRFLVVAQGLRPDGRPCFGTLEFAVE